MRQALRVGLNAENSNAYKELAESFDVTGAPAYKEDGVTPCSSDTFKFNDDDGIKDITLSGNTWRGNRPDEIYKKLNDLIVEIEALNKT